MDDKGRIDAMKEAPTFWGALVLLAAVVAVLAFVSVRDAILPPLPRKTR